MFLIKKLGILIIVFYLTACAEKKIEPEVYLIPEGYVGSFLIIYGVESGEDPVYENESRLFRLPESGVFHTKLSDNVGIGYPDMIRFFYLAKDGTRKEIVNSYGSVVEDTVDNRNDKKIYVMGGSFGNLGFTEDTTALGCKYNHQRFYVGTLKDRLEGVGNFRLGDYYLKHGYPCNGKLFKI